MRAETVKRMILLSVEKPPEDMEELLELYARLWSQENGGDWRPLRAAEKGTESVPEGTESVPEGTERVIEPTENVIEPEESAPEPAEAVSGEPPPGRGGAIQGRERHPGLLPHPLRALRGGEDLLRQELVQQVYLRSLRAGDEAEGARASGEGYLQVREQECLLHQRGGERL